MDSYDLNIPEIRIGEGRLTSINIERQVCNAVQLDHGQTTFNGTQNTITVHGIGKSYFALSGEMFQKLMHKRAVLVIRFLED